MEATATDTAQYQSRAQRFSVKGRSDYRADIDGLRAVAVLAVLLFHAEFTLFGRSVLPGGFLGVDIFFVISGYLITSLIARRIASGTFSLLEFYDRRARRILPALFALIIVVGVATLGFGRPDMAASTGREMLATLGFGSNVLFALEDPYFAADSQMRPLLHGWSLAVEEQFYLIWPFVILALAKFGRAGTVMAALTAGSFVAAMLMERSNANVAFYLLPFRLWELMAGGLLAVMVVPVRRGAPRGLLRAVGYALILLPMVMWGTGWPHPSWPTLFPVVGTLILILHGSGLSAMPLAVIGRISYSLYLWHFAALALMRLAFGRDLSAGLTLLTLIWSVGMAVISYRLIETPFRDRRHLPARRAYPWLGGGAGVIVALAALMIWRGGTERVAADIQALLSASERAPTYQDGRYCRDRIPAEACRFGAGLGEEDVVRSGRPIYLVGDSHAQTLIAPLRELAAARNRPLVLFLEGGCPVLFQGGYRATYPVQRRRNCPDQSSAVRDYLQSAPPGTVVHFTYLSGYLGYPGQVPLLSDPDGDATTLDGPIQGAVDSFAAIAQAGHEIVILDPMPTLPETPRAALERRFAEDSASSMDELVATLPHVDRDTYRAQRSATDPVLARIAAESGAERVRFDEAMCGSGVCAVMVGDAIFHSDTDHPSPAAARWIVEQIEDRL